MMSKLWKIDPTLYKVARRPCEYCRDHNNCATTHAGVFITVPMLDERSWRQGIEYATGRRIVGAALEKWYDRLALSICRVGIEHLVVIDNHFSKENPVFFEKTGSPSVGDGKFISSKSPLRSGKPLIPVEDQQPLRKSKKEMFCSQLKQILENKGKRFLGLENSLLMMGLIEKSSQGEQISGLFQSPDQLDLSLSTTVNNSGGKGYRFTQPIRNLICTFAALGLSQRKIPLCINELVKELLPQSANVSIIPSKTSVHRIISEGYIISKLQALKRIHSMTSSRCLFHDGTPSRGKNLLAVGVQNENESVLLGLKRTIRHDGVSISNEIREVLAEISDFASSLPETKDFISSLVPSNFTAVIGDHTGSNLGVADNLGISNKLFCHAHKVGLVDTHFVKTFSKEPKRQVLVRDSFSVEPNLTQIYDVRMEPEEEQESDYEVEELGEDQDWEEENEEGEADLPIEMCEFEEKKGMTSIKGTKNPNSAPHYLYVLSNSLALTSKDKWGHAIGMHFWLLMHQGLQPIRLKPLFSSRFGVYSFQALEVYRYSSLFRTYIGEHLKAGSWTRKFLEESLGSEEMTKQLRSLSLFHYFFAGPMMLTLSTLTVEEASHLWKRVEYWVYYTMTKTTTFVGYTNGGLSVIWKEVGNTVEKKGMKWKEIQFEAWVKLRPVLRDWTVEDDSLFLSCLKGAFVEIQKIAVEYLEGGSLEVVPSHLKSLPADNIAAERVFAQTSTLDTHAKHPGQRMLEFQMLWAQSLQKAHIPLSEESLAMVRREASKLPKEGEEMLRLAKIQKEVCAEKEKENKELKERKRKKDVKTKDELQGAVLIEDMEQLKMMTGTQLRIQLMLRNKMNPNKKICYGVAKKEEMLKRFQNEKE
jgi:hypothetical protein